MQWNFKAKFSYTYELMPGVEVSVERIPSDWLKRCKNGKGVNLLGLRGFWVELDDFELRRLGVYAFREIFPNAANIGNVTFTGCSGTCRFIISFEKKESEKLVPSIRYEIDEPPMAVKEIDAEIIRRALIYDFHVAKVENFDILCEGDLMLANYYPARLGKLREKMTAPPYQWVGELTEENFRCDGQTIVKWLDYYAAVSGICITKELLFSYFPVSGGKRLILEYGRRRKDGVTITYTIRKRAYDDVVLRFDEIFPSSVRGIVSVIASGPPHRQLLQAVKLNVL